MRIPVRQNRRRSQTAIPRSLPAPTLGWNTDDALAAMKPGYAVILDNWIPRAGKIEMRRGYIEQVTGMSDPVETLVVYSGGSTDTIFACSGASIFDVTTAGALGSAEYASAASARWSWVNFANDAGRFALMCNGAQTPIKWDGSTFSTNAVTGTSGAITLDDDDLKYVFAHKNRLHWLEEARLRVWVTATNAIAGSSTLLDLGPLFSSGGVLVGGATWSRDNGAGGLDDLAVYVTSEGQAAVYQGSDPTDVNNWGLVGVYEFAKPVGERALIKDGGELCIVTQEGVLPLSVLIAAKRFDQRGQTLSRPIDSSFATSALTYGSLNGRRPTTPGAAG
jgi:hypothetical protein